jgi:hypothetical protein
MAKNALTMSMKLPTDKELDRMLADAEFLRAFKVQAEAVEAASLVVRNRARQLAPRSKPQDRVRRSRKQKAEADWESVPLNTTIDFVVRDYKKGSTGIIGPAYPHGNKAYFNQPRAGQRKQVLWGKMTRLKPYIAARNWIVQAFEETKSQQLSAMKTALRDAIDRLMKV